MQGPTTYDSWDVDSVVWSGRHHQDLSLSKWQGCVFVLSALLVLFLFPILYWHCPNFLHSQVDHCFYTVPPLRTC